MNYLDVVDDTNVWHVWKKTLRRHYYHAVQTNNKNKLLAGLIALFFINYLFVFGPNNATNAAHSELLNPSTSRFNMLNHFDELPFLYNKLNPNDPHVSLRAKLAFYFPYDASQPLPKNIFQTWKCPKDSDQFPKNFKSPFDSWTNQNPKWNHILLTDDILDSWIEEEFFNVPEILKVWKMLPKFILKADFFRYLVLFARGGVYSDIDTFCLKSIDENWPIDLNENGIVVGIEADPDRPDWAEWYARRIQFVQWTIVSKKGHPLLREVISRIVSETLRKKDNGKLNKVEGKDEGTDIMQWTGPGIFTDTVFDYINNVASDGEFGDGFGIGTEYWSSGKKFNLKKQELDHNNMPLNSEKMKYYNWKQFTNLEEPIDINDHDVLVVPITGFSPGVGQMGSKEVGDPLAMVKHLFEGSWKPEDERM